jgi:undecaprenyl-diphosphatase
MEYTGEYGMVLALMVLGLWAWRRFVRHRGTREEAVSGFAGLLWAPLAAAIALLVNIPIRDFVERPRPFVDHRGLDVLVVGKSDYSFVSDHATLAMALAVGIFMVHRKSGLLGILLAVGAGFSRVYMGVHYPTDVIGGLALGAAITLLLAPLAMWLLTPLVRAVAASPRVGGLVWARGAESAPGAERDGEQGELADADSAAAPQQPLADGERTDGDPAGRPEGQRSGPDRDLAA